MTLYITRAEAQLEIGRLVAEQIGAFNAQRQVIVAQSEEVRLLNDELAADADAALKRNHVTAEEQTAQQVGDLRTHNRDVTLINPVR